MKYTDQENVKTAWYISYPDESGRGTHFYTECGNKMFSIRTDRNLYDGKLCPRCFMLANLKVVLKRRIEMEFEIYKIGTKSYLVFKPSLTEDEVKTLANKHFKRKISQLVAKKCVVQRDTLYLEGGRGTKVWAVWVG